jgi:hypothetical protein
MIRQGLQRQRPTRYGRALPQSRGRVLYSIGSVVAFECAHLRRR